jgi:hypothetical protein
VRLLRTFALLLVLAAGACGREAAEPARPAAVVPATVTDVRRQELSVAGVTGLSDLARDPDGRTWAVAERVRVALRVDRPGAAPVAVPLVGVPEDLDVEGMAFIDREEVALATESDKGARKSDALLLARLGPAGIQVVGRRDLDYSIFPLDPIANQGLEGLCHAGPYLVAAVETVIANPEERFAPIAVLELASDRWTPLLVRLTTRTGKLSALSCLVRRDRALDVLAIERHFEVARLIRFRIPAPLPDRRPPPVLEPVLVAELGPAMIHQENFEGLLWDGGRNISLVVDNDWTHVTGPNLLLTARLYGAIPAPR